MRALVLLALLPLAGCGPDFWNQPATPASSGVTAVNNGTDPRGGGADQPFPKGGSQRTFGLGTQR